MKKRIASILNSKYIQPIYIIALISTGLGFLGITEGYNSDKIVSKIMGICFMYLGIEKIYNLIKK